jgi:hypothetical protein
MARIARICAACNTVIRPGDAPCPTCDVTPAKRSPLAKGVMVGMIDGDTSGYYPRETGFPVDPTNPMKRIAPAKRKTHDAFKRASDVTEGRVALAE